LYIGTIPEMQQFENRTLSDPRLTRFNLKEPEIIPLFNELPHLKDNVEPLGITMVFPPRSKSPLIIYVAPSVENCSCRGKDGLTLMLLASIVEGNRRTKQSTN
jgi:hypothetical protein